MKILVISGFLGAGKTTFIQTMAKVTGRDFVIYENEYAGVGIDTGRLRENEQLNVWESTENCVCCSGKADFASSVITISCSLDPEYLIVEPTGLARLGNILSNVSQILYGNISLLRPAVIVDALAFGQHRAAYPDIYLNQVRSASYIYVSKTDRLSAEECALLRAELEKINPEAEIHTELWSELTAADFTRLLHGNAAEGTTAPMDDVSESGPSMEQMTLSNVSLPSPVHLVAFLNALSYGSCGTITRAKGTLPCGGQWLMFDFVENLWQITGASPGARGECIIIGPALQRGEIRRRVQEELYIVPPKNAKKQIRSKADLLKRAN